MNVFSLDKFEKAFIMAEKALRYGKILLSENNEIENEFWRYQIVFYYGKYWQITKVNGQIIQVSKQTNKPENLILNENK